MARRLFRPTDALAAALAAAWLTAAPPVFAGEDGGPASWRALPRAEMMEEDSHPHEVPPGAEARFHVAASDRPSLMAVKCSLSGPASRATVRFSGMTVKEWPLPDRTFDLKPGTTLWLDIVTIVPPDGPDTPYFAFRNLDGSALLWHQCYNN